MWVLTRSNQDDNKTTKTCLFSREFSVEHPVPGLECVCVGGGGGDPSTNFHPQWSSCIAKSMVSASVSKSTKTWKKRSNLLLSYRELSAEHFKDDNL